jgi:hypothetical protein
MTQRRFALPREPERPRLERDAHPPSTFVTTAVRIAFIAASSVFQ